MKKEIVNAAVKAKKPKILEAEFSTRANQEFHRISDSVREEIGLPMGDKVFPEWQKWLNQEIRKTRL